ncbi:hypothetical protein ACFVZH_38145 [Streptomyces sp. NPDC059534]|uniref:hypothetical protein n=1 Tax=Streptomyces sp. NPDC059534 TaxID=3346859 RepID=UPI0036B3A5B7
MILGGMRIQCGERAHLSDAFKAVVAAAGIEGKAPSTVRCVVERHRVGEEVHHAVLSELPLRDAGDIWVSWLDSREPHEVERRLYCPVTAGPGIPCELHAMHPDGHSWELTERYLTD